MPTADGKRSFWMHQLAEYVIGFALVATGLQSPEPLVPTLLGALIVLNTACVDAPFGAFRKVGRRMHRVLDIVVFEHDVYDAKTIYEAIPQALAALEPDAWSLEK